MSNDDFLKMPRKDVLGAPIGGMSSTRHNGGSGVLAIIFRKMLSDLGITSHAMTYLAKTYCENLKKRSIVANAGAEKTKIVKPTQFNPNVLLKEILGNKITIKVFMKALKVLRVTNVEFAVTITRANAITVHKHSIDLNNPQEDEEHETEEV